MPAARDPSGQAFTCGACPPGTAGNGTLCPPCTLTVTIQRTGGADGVPRAAPAQLFGAAVAPAFTAVGGFACPAPSALLFSWSLTQLGKAVPLSAANQVNTPTLYLPPRTLAAGASVRATLRVCYPALPGVAAQCSTSTTTFGVTASQLQPVLSGGNVTTGDGSVVALDASASSDPDAEPGSLLFAWACADSRGGSCSFTNGTALAAGATVQLLQLAVGTYAVSLTVSKGNRTASVSTSLTITRGAALVVAIAGLPAPQVDPSAKLALLATVTLIGAAVAPPAALTATWSVTSAPPGTPPLNLTDPQTVLSAAGSVSLVLAPGVLRPGPYVFRLDAALSPAGTAALGDAGAGSATVLVAVAAPPSGLGGPGTLGALTVSPARGIALNTTFSAATSGWLTAPPQGPLQYRFSYLVPGSGAAGTGGNDAILAPFNPSPAATFTLPAGVTAGGIVTVRCLVQNAAGVAASAPLQFNVTVTPPPVDALLGTGGQAVAATTAAQVAIRSGDVATALSAVGTVANTVSAATSAAVPNATLDASAAAVRESLASVVALAVAASAPTADALAQASAAMESVVTAPPAQVSSSTQALGVRVLARAAAGGSLVSAATGANVVGGLSSIGLAAAAQVAGATTAARVGMMVVKAPAAPPAPSLGGLSSSATSLLSVPTVLSTLAGSLGLGFAVAGEAPVALASPAITLRVALDTSDPASSRLTTQGLGAGGGSDAAVAALSVFAPLPVAALAAAKGGPVGSQFAALAFDPYTGVVGSQASAAGITRLQLTTTVTGEQRSLPVTQLPAPVTFTMPANVVDGRAQQATCRFFDPAALSYRRECTA